MRRVLLLAWRYIAHNKAKSAVLVACITITTILPITIHTLVRLYNAELVARAETTPLIVGAKGNRYDLCLKSLYFRAEEPETHAYHEVRKLLDSGLCSPMPLHLKYTARTFPVVGTSPEYFAFRGLRLASGALPVFLGEAVIGNEVAERLALGAGDKIMSDQVNLYDLSQTYPLKMMITGVLERADTPDDSAVFIDVKTAWVIDGNIHGHSDVTKNAPKTAILEKTDTNVSVDSSIIEYNEITPENLASFHAHGDPEDFEITSVLVVPDGKKPATLLKGRYKVSKDRQMIVPLAVIGELMGIVFKVEMFFRANQAVVLVSTILFLGLVVVLSLRLRRREMQTMFRIGCSRMTIFWVQAAELGIILLMSVALAGAFSAGLILLAPELVSVL